MNKDERNKIIGKCTLECSIKKDNLCCFDCDDLEKCKYLCGYIKNYDISKKFKCGYFKEESNEIKHDIPNNINNNDKIIKIPKCKLDDCSLNKGKYTCCFYCNDFEKCKNEEIVCDHALSYNTAEGCPYYINHIIGESEYDTSNNNNKVTIKVKTYKTDNLGTKTEITTICHNNKEMQFTYEYSSFGDVTMSKGISHKTICGILDFLEIEYFVVLYE